MNSTLYVSFFLDSSRNQEFIPFLMINYARNLCKRYNIAIERVSNHSILHQCICNHVLRKVVSSYQFTLRLRLSTADCYSRFCRKMLKKFKGLKLLIVFELNNLFLLREAIKNEVKYCGFVSSFGGEKTIPKFEK